MLFSTRISGLEGQVSELQAQVETLNGSLKAALAERDEAMTQLAGFEGFVSPQAHAAVIAERDQAATELADAKAKIPAQVEQAASEKAIEIAASVGVPPVDAEKPAAAKPQAKEAPTMSRADFMKLSPAEQTAFAKQHGRLTE